MRSLAGYTLGRSDLVRRAMSKKKAAVMAKERKNFVYGNEEEGVPGCIANGIDEKTANKIYDEMTDFAKYAFNKSHAAAYAVVSYQTAYLKYYYPVEYMAALLTSVIDNPSKVAEYIFVCRQMGIQILPPDINRGDYSFSVDGKNIRYGLNAIKSIGRPVVLAICEERRLHGPYKNLKDFVTRLTNKEVNKRVVENFIKSGAMDCLEGSRRQKMEVYPRILETVVSDRKNAMQGQMTLFDLISEEDRREYEIKLPNVEEYPQDVLLAFEKEVLGIYLSGHPLDEFRGILEKNVSANTLDFQPDEETGLPGVRDGQKVILGGMITEKSIKYTRKNQVMAFLTLEDLVGTVEIVVFPRDYERDQQLLQEEAKVFIQGRVSAEEDRASKLIYEKIRPFSDMPRELWIQFADKKAFMAREKELYEDLKDSDGNSTVVIYLKDVKAMKKLPPNRNIEIEQSLIARLEKKYGQGNVKVVERVLKNF